MHNLPAMNKPMRPFFLDLHDAAKAVSLSTGSIQALVRKGDFPKPRLLSARRVAWLTREVEEWAEARPISNCLPPVNAGKRRDS
jgi:prophage regulatory protein